MKVSTKENPIYYVYFSYEEWGLGYIGQRTCPPGLTVEEDFAYKGSYRHENFNPTQKIILAEFDTIEQALDLEIALHRLYHVADNKKFANLAEQRSNKMRAATTKSPQTRRKLSVLNTGPNNPNYGRRGPSHWHYGKKLSQAQKDKISAGLMGRECTQEARQKSSKNNSKTKRSKAPKYDWINKITGEIEEQLCILDLADKYHISHRVLRRCVKGTTSCKNTDWIIKSQSE